MEAEKEKATNDDCSQAASSIEVPEIVAGAVSPVKDESDSPAENSNGKSSQNENTLTWEKAVSMETTESAHESSDSDSGADNDGLSDYEKLRLERIRRNQEYLSRLGLEEQKDKLRPQKRARKKKDESTVPEETSQQRKASLRRKTEQVRYSDVSIREILGRKTRAPESQSRKRKPERDVQHRMERFIYREFQRMQAERNTSQKQIELLIRRIEKETAFWKKLVEQNESREQLSQTRRSELEAERAIFGGLTLRQLLKQIDQRFPELIQAAKDYDQEIKEMCQNGKNEAEKRQKQLQIQRLRALDIYPIVLKNATSLLDAILYERFADLGAPHRRSNRSNHSVPVSYQQFPKTNLDAIPESPAKRFIEGCGSYNGQSVAHHVGGWVSPHYASIISRSWPDRKDIYIPQVGDIVLYYPVGHRLFLEKYPDSIGENSAARTPLWKRAEIEKDAASDWWNPSWLRSVDAGQAVYPLICRITETHFEFPPDDPFIQAVKADGSISWKRREKTALMKHHQSTSVRLAIALRPLSPVLPEILPLPPCFSVVWFPSSDAKPYLIPFQKAYTAYHSLSTGTVVTADEISVVVQDFIKLNERSMRLDENLPSSFDQNTALSISETLEKEMATLSPEHRIASHELRPIVLGLTQKLLGMSGPSRSDEKNLASRQNETIVSLIRSTLPLWEGVSCVPRSNKRVEVPLSPWEVQPRDFHSRIDVLERSIQELVEFVIDRTVREHSESDLFHDILTDDEAPSYLCAVPIAMSTSVVVRKLRCRYYRSINSILNDFDAILGNCLLYNTPDAPVVAKAQSFVATVQNNIIDAVVQGDKVHANLGLSGIHSTFHLDDNGKGLYCKLANTSPYKGSLERQWMYNGMSWAPQTGDFVIYSQKLHIAFVDFHSRDLTEKQCDTVEHLPDDVDEIESVVLWTKPCFPQQRRKHSLGTFNEDAPLMEVALQFPEDVATVYWRPCILSADETLNCGCGCLATFLRPAHRPSNPGLSPADVGNLALIFAALKQKCLEQTSALTIDPTLSKKIVKEGYVPATYPFETSSNLSNTNQLTLCGFLADASSEELAYPLPELCLDLVLRRLKKDHYRSRGAIENDIIESFVNAVSMRLTSLTKIERSHVSMMNIALAFVQNHGVNKEEKRFLNVVQKIRELHAAALSSAAGIDCSVTLFGSKNHDTLQDIVTTDSSRDAARQSLAALLSALVKDPALNFTDLHAAPKPTIKITCAGKTITHRKDVAVFQNRMVNLAGGTKMLKVFCEGRPFTCEFDLDDLDENNDGEPPIHARDITSVEMNCISFSMDELDNFSHVAQFFFGRPGKLHACARCQVKGRTFLDCRVQRRHSNIDFDWKSAFQAFGGIDGLMGSLFPDRKKTMPAQQSENCEIAVSDESHAASLASLREIFQTCAEVLEQATNMGIETHRLSNLPIRLSKQFLEEAFPVDPTDGRYMYCIICGISGDLFCCDKCPNVFHTGCLGLDNVPAGEWFCEECNSTKGGVSSLLPFGRSEFDQSQLEQLDAKVNLLRHMRADRTKRQDTGSTKRKDRGQDTVGKEVASESRTKGIENLSHLETRRRSDTRKLGPNSIVQDFPRRRGRPRKSEQTKQQSPHKYRPASEDESESHSIEKVPHLPRRRCRSASRKLQPPSGTVHELPRRRGRPRKAEQVVRFPQPPPSQNVEEHSNPMSSVPERIQPSDKRKGGRPPKRARVTEPDFPVQKRPHPLSASNPDRPLRHRLADESAFIKSAIRNRQWRVSNDKDSKMKKRQSTSRRKAPAYSQPHCFVEDLKIEDAAIREAKITALARRSARLSK